MTLPMPLRSTSRPTTSTRCRRPRGATGPSVVNRRRSTPHGMTLIRRRSPPIRTSSNTSSVHVAMMWSMVRTKQVSVSMRSAGLVSFGALLSPLHDPERMERLHDGHAERAGRPSSDARPDIQKWAWTTSGRRLVDQ